MILKTFCLNVGHRCVGSREQFRFKFISKKKIFCLLIILLGEECHSSLILQKHFGITNCMFCEQVIFEVICNLASLFNMIHELNLNLSLSFHFKTFVLHLNHNQLNRVVCLVNFYLINTHLS